MAKFDAEANTPHPSGSASRRQFLKTAAVAGASAMIVPRRVLGQGMVAPSDTLNIATVGFHGMGASNTENVLSENIVAICDCDFKLLDDKLKEWREQVYPTRPPQQASQNQRRQQPESPFRTFGPSEAQQAANARWAMTPKAETKKRFIDEQVPRLKRYRDYREMLEKQRDIDAVIVATPDHMHAPIASAAMDLGRHVYVQKPLCWSVYECRFLAKKAADTGVVTQMGNQGHSQDDARRGQEYLRAGAIGDVTEVHVWTNRPYAYWPQGIPRPRKPEGDLSKLPWSSRGVEQRLAAAMASESIKVPSTLSWDLFLGAAPVVPYHPVYHPFNWRGWVDWGQGALGDMGAHLIDHPVWGLDLGLPTSVETSSTIFDGVCYPTAASTHYEFAARDGKPAVKMTWYDGGLLPARPEELGEEKLSAEGGVLYIGTKGKMLQNTYGARPRLLPAERHNSFGAPPEVLPRIPHESHEMNWVNAIKGTDRISCPFSYAAHLNEIMLLGVVALRAKTKLAYDGVAMRITNDVDANEFLTRTYREGFGL